MSSRLSAVFVGDLHLSKPQLLRLFGEQATTFILDSVRRVLDEAIKKKIKYAFFLGDLCDQPSFRDPDELALQELLFEYDGRIEMHIILGNHDKEQKTVHSLSKIANLVKRGVFQSVYIYSKHRVKTLDGVKVEFMPYPFKIPKHSNSLCLAHLERPGSKTDSGMTLTPIADEPEGDNLWVIGHLHTPQKVGRHSYYPGTLDQKNFGESLPKKTVTLEAWMEKGQIKYDLNWQDHEPAFKLLTVDASEIDQLETADNIRYKVTNKTGVKLSDTFMVDNPNVIEVVQQGRETVDLSDLHTVTVTYEFKKRVIDFLKSRGHTRQEIRRGRGMLRKVKKGESLCG